MSETAKSPRSAPLATGGFEDATRERLRLRMAIDGPSGSGKSVTAQRFAIALAKAAAALAGRAENDLRIATICSEHRSARKYVGMDFGDGPLRFKVKDLAHYAPTEYTSAIEVAGTSGFDVLVIDGLSQAWEGKEGALELVDRAGGNRFTAWRDVTPMHRRMIDAILNSPCHVIVTMRAKTEYVLEPDEHGKQVPRRLGIAPIQRSGMEYEFDLFGSMNWDHILTITKSRCPAMDGRIFHKPGAAAMAPVIAWLNTGEWLAEGPVVRFITDKQMERVLHLTAAAGWTMDRVRKDLPKNYGVAELAMLREADGERLCKWLESHAKAEERKREQLAAVPPSSPPAAPQASAARGTITDQQLVTLKTYRGELFAGQPDAVVTQAWLSILARRGVTSALHLSTEQADELIAAMAHKLNLRGLDQGINGRQANGTTPNGSPMTQPNGATTGTADVNGTAAEKGGMPAPAGAKSGGE